MTKSQLSGLGKRIKAFRKEKNWNQQQLSELVDLTTSAVGRMEIGKSMPSIEVFAKMCIALEVSADQLLFGENAPSIVQDEAAKYETKDEFLKKYVETLERENALLRDQKKS